MCNPMAAMIVMTAATGAFTAYTQKQTGDYQAEVQKNNMIISRRMAEDAINRGRRAEDAHRMKVASMKSSQEAKMSASGLDVSSGSPSDILTDTAILGELDALTIRSNAEREAYGNLVSATSHQAQSQLSQYTGNTQAAGTILNTGAQVGKQWYIGQGSTTKKKPTSASTGGGGQPTLMMSN